MFKVFQVANSEWNGYEGNGFGYVIKSGNWRFGTVILVSRKCYSQVKWLLSMYDCNILVKSQYEYMGSCHCE